MEPPARLLALIRRYRVGLLGGLVVATLTPFGEDGSLDLPSLAAHIRELVQAGAEGLFVAGTTGEGLLLEEDERVAVVEAAARAAAGRVPVVALCSGLSTAQSAHLARRMRGAGADGLAVLTPFYYRVDAAAMVEHFARVAEAAASPTYVYSIPGLTGVSLPVEVLRQLTGHPHFGGLKFSCCDLDQLTAYVATGAPVLIGCDSLITRALQNGAAGTVSGTAAALPEPFSRLLAALRRGEDTTAAQELATRLDALMAGLPPIAGHKAALLRRGVIASATVRRPRRPLAAGEEARLEAGLRALGL